MAASIFAGTLHSAPEVCGCPKSTISPEQVESLAGFSLATCNVSYGIPKDHMDLSVLADAD